MQNENDKDCVVAKDLLRTLFEDGGEDKNDSKVTIGALNDKKAMYLSGA